MFQDDNGRFIILIMTELTYELSLNFLRRFTYSILLQSMSLNDVVY